MILNRRPRTGEIVKVNPEWIDRYGQELFGKRWWRWCRGDCWLDKSLKYRAETHGTMVVLYPIGLNDGHAGCTFLDNGRYSGLEDFPFFITADHNASLEDIKYCQCGSTSYRTLPMFNTVVKICQQCGKDKYDRYKEKFNMDGDNKATVLIVLIIALIFIVAIGTIGFIELTKEKSFAKQRDAIIQCISTCKTTQCKKDCHPPENTISCMSKCEDVFYNDSTEFQCVKLCFGKQGGWDQNILESPNTK